MSTEIAGPVILVAVHHGHNLRFYLHQQFEHVVDLAYRDEIIGLIDDMRQRDPDSTDRVFEQLTQLNIGPLALDEVGYITGEECILRLYPDMILLQ